MKKLGFILGSIILLVWLVDSDEKETPSKAKTEVKSPFVFAPATGQSLKYRIAKIDKLKKGGSVTPFIEPKYTLLVVGALVESQGSYEEPTVERTLRKIVAELVDKHQPDGVSVKLFNSEQNLKLGTPWIAEADWWPRGHSFSPSNSDYINAKEYHVFTANFSFPQGIRSELISTEIPIERRKEIYAKAYQMDLKAMRDANDRYPLDTPEQASKNIDEADRLSEKYRSQIISEFNLTEEEIDQIIEEGINRKWPNAG